MPIPIIDLFAGPGGLGEGFSCVKGADGKPAFKIRLSIEMDPGAHQTLQLRAFYRQFPKDDAPNAYYDYLRGTISKEGLFERYKAEFKVADDEAWNATLGKNKPTEVSDRISLALGKNKDRWLLIGGPPCQAYSLVGRSKMIGDKGRSEFEKDHRHFLYREYLRIIAEHQPAVFVMENVKGLLSAKVDGHGMIGRILDDLEDPLKAFPELKAKSRRPNLRYTLHALAEKQDPGRGFDPRDFLLRAENYGIPQARHRVIIVGVRNDIQRKPAELKTIHSPVTVQDVIGDLPPLRSGLSDNDDSSPLAWKEAVCSIVNARWLHKEADPTLCKAIEIVARRVPKTLQRGARFLPCKPGPAKYMDWFVKPRLAGVCNHETRTHLTADLHRYLFAAVYANQCGTSPLLEDLPKALLPEHKNVAEALRSTKFNDRFRVQLRNRPSTTVVSHISKDGHYYIHYDPEQCRSLTVREAARLQTFPDDYFFEGPRTQQYHQVGNAVPPLLALKIAESVHKLFT